MSSMFFFIFIFFLKIGLISDTAAEHTAISTGRSFFTFSNISLADTIFISSTFLSGVKLDGPNTNVVFTPNFDKEFAISIPCLPLDSLDKYLIGSKYSLVGPAVTIAFSFLLFTKSLFKK